MAELESLKKAYESAKTGYEQAEQEIQSLSRQMEEEKEAAGKSELRGAAVKRPDSGFQRADPYGRNDQRAFKEPDKDH